MAPIIAGFALQGEVGPDLVIGWRRTWRRPICADMLGSGMLRTKAGSMTKALRFLPLAALLVLPVSAEGQASREAIFDDPLFRQCISWLLDGERGGMIDNLCLERYAIPTPSQFICARKIFTGFESAADQEGCAIIFEEQAKKVRAGYIR